MCGEITKKTSVIFAVLCITVLVSGCETFSAIKSKDVNGTDVSQILKTAVSDKESTGNPITENPVVEKAKKADDWMQKNLW